MKKFIIILTFLLLAAGMVSVFVWPYIKMEFASSARYTEKDKLEYDYYTPELLKKMPRISDDYEFSHTNISGPQAFVFGLQFNETTDTKKIRDYLISAGYKSQKHCDIEAECWRSPQNKDVVSLYKSTQLNLVGVEIYSRPYKR